MPGAPVGMPGAPTGMPGAEGGMPGMPGAGGEAAAAAPAAPAVVLPPLEPSRPNPFGGVGVATKSLTQELRTRATKYGPDWSRIPITRRVGFLQPTRPPHPAPGPSASEAAAIATGAGAKIRISSILWSEGSPLATYESTSGETGTVGPGDLIDKFRVVEIGRDYVVVMDTKTNVPQRLPLKTE
jgi:hypothetical protein